MATNSAPTPQHSVVGGMFQTKPVAGMTPQQDVMTAGATRAHAPRTPPSASPTQANPPAPCRSGPTTRGRSAAAALAVSSCSGGGVADALRLLQQEGRPSPAEQAPPQSPNRPAKVVPAVSTSEGDLQHTRLRKECGRQGVRSDRLTAGEAPGRQVPGPPAEAPPQREASATPQGEPLQRESQQPAQDARRKRASPRQLGPRTAAGAKRPRAGPNLPSSADLAAADGPSAARHAGAPPHGPTPVHPASPAPQPVPPSAPPCAPPNPPDVAAAAATAPAAPTPAPMRTPAHGPAPAEPVHTAGAPRSPHTADGGSAGPAAPSAAAAGVGRRTLPAAAPDTLPATAAGVRAAGTQLDSGLSSDQLLSRHAAARRLSEAVFEDAVRQVECQAVELRELRTMCTELVVGQRQLAAAHGEERRRAEAVGAELAAARAELEREKADRGRAEQEARAEVEGLRAEARGLREEVERREGEAAGRVREVEERWRRAYARKRGRVAALRARVAEVEGEAGGLREAGARAAAEAEEERGQLRRQLVEARAEAKAAVAEREALRAAREEGRRRLLVQLGALVALERSEEE